MVGDPCSDCGLPVGAIPSPYLVLAGDEMSSRFSGVYAGLSTSSRDNLSFKAISQDSGESVMQSGCLVFKTVISKFRALDSRARTNS